jgi:tetratricopeptide (TPR) repeat protein
MKDEMSFAECKRRVDLLVKQGLLDEALAQCDFLIVQHPEWRVDIIRLRAYTYARKGMYPQAISEREALIESGDGMLRDYFQLGDNLLSAGRFAAASESFQEVLRLGAEQNESWFESAALLLLAYAQLRLGQLQLAIVYLDRAVAINPESAMPVHGEGMLTHQDLRIKIDEALRQEEAKNGSQ